MSDTIKAALIVASAIVVATGLYIYYSPYHSCVRAGGGAAQASDWCARATGR